MILFLPVQSDEDPLLDDPYADYSIVRDEDWRLRPACFFDLLPLDPPARFASYPLHETSQNLLLSRKFGV